MVDGLAGQSGGAFSLSSQVGIGTCASLWLPVSEEPAAPIAVSEIVGEKATTAAKVLLVDDEEIVREATADMLADAAYKVIQAGSAAEALRIVGGDSRPDIVIADYKMPGMSGIELAEALRATRPSLPVLLITGFANLTDADLAGLPHLAKPFREVEITARVAKLLDGATAAKSELRILVVEDEPIIALELVSAIKEEAGCAVAGVANSVDEALAMIALERPNAAILDANLNGSTSAKIAEALRRQNTPYFVLSGHSSKNSLPPPLNEAPFLQKPYRESELLQRIHGLLEANRNSNCRC